MPKGTREGLNPGEDGLLTREELKGLIQGLETQSVQVSNCSIEMLRWIEDGPTAVARLLADMEQLQRDLEFERSTNNFDAKRLRRLATLVGASTPESDETLLGCAGTVIGSICLQVERSFKDHKAAVEAVHSLMVERDRYKAVGERLSAENDELSQRVCSDCDPENYGWIFNRVEGKAACGCMIEAEPFQILQTALETISKAATGEIQIADDDTEGMGWIAKEAAKALHSVLPMDYPTEASQPRDEPDHDPADHLYGLGTDPV